MHLSAKPQPIARRRPPHSDIPQKSAAVGVPAPRGEYATASLPYAFDSGRGARAPHNPHHKIPPQAHAPNADGQSVTEPAHLSSHPQPDNENNPDRHDVAQATLAGLTVSLIPRAPGLRLKRRGDSRFEASIEIAKVARQDTESTTVTRRHASPTHRHRSHSAATVAWRIAAPVTAGNGVCIVIARLTIRTRLHRAQLESSRVLDHPRARRATPRKGTQSL